MSLAETSSNTRKTPINKHMINSQTSVTFCEATETSLSRIGLFSSNTKTLQK